MKFKKQVKEVKHEVIGAGKVSYKYKVRRFLVNFLNFFAPRLRKTVHIFIVKHKGEIQGYGFYKRRTNRAKRKHSLKGKTIETYITPTLMAFYSENYTFLH